VNIQDTSCDNVTGVTMKILFLLGLMCATLSAQSPNTLSRQEKKDGWQLLFDGKTKKGWTGRQTFEPFSTGDWRVSGGALLCGGTLPSWLSTNASFKDFQLTLEFRGIQKVNGGVFLRSEKEGEPHVTGYELQIWDYQPAGFLTGSLVNHAKPSTTDPKVIGDEWNKYDITAKGDHFIIVLNGKTVLDTHNSAHAAGVIGLQCQLQQRIEFRNIKIKPL